MPKKLLLLVLSIGSTTCLLAGNVENVRDLTDYEVLSWALQNKRTKIALSLIKDLPTDTLSKRGPPSCEWRSLLDWAIFSQELVAAERMLRKGVIAEVRPGSGTTLMRLLEYNGRLCDENCSFAKAVQLLLSYGLPVNDNGTEWSDPPYVTPLVLAIRRRVDCCYGPVIKILLDYGASLDFRMHDTALHEAVTCGKLLGVQLLLEAANQPDDDTADDTSHAVERPPRKKRKTTNS